jgi:hypothetical protein
MKRRRTEQRSARFCLTGSIPALLLAVILIVMTGPAAVASTARTRTQSVSAAPQTDPIAALAASLDYDPLKIFRYVSDEIRYEPYSGILRGAAGTLAAQAGNSVDKALLLGALFDDSRVAYRYAQGSLDEASTATIVDSITTDAAAARVEAEAPLKRGMDELAAAEASATGPLAQLYRQQAGSIVSDAKARFDLAGSRLTDTASLLETALEGAGLSLPTTGIALPPSESHQHTWVEMANGAAWVDLDPTLPASAPGTLLTAVSNTIYQLPDDLRYQVTFNVRVETASGGQLVTDDVLTYSGFADQLAGTPITFGHVTPSGLKALGLAIGNLLGEGWLDYRPTLQVGSNSFVADRNVAFPLGDGLGGVFGGEPSPGASPGPVDGEATAEWLEVAVTPPGGEPSVARRTIFDRLPAELRATNQLTPSAIEPIALVDPDGTGRSDFLPMVGNRTFSIATGPTRAIPPSTTDAPLGNFASAYQDARDAIDADAALDAGARVFLDGPDIVSASIDLTGDASPANVQMGLDIWHRSHGVLPLSGSHLSAADSELVAGVADHIAERFAIERLVAFGRSSSPPAISVGVGDVFEAAATQGIPTIVLEGALPTSLPYGATPTGLIGEALAAGDVVVVPEKPVTIAGHERVGWWTIDPDTGATTDVMDTGAGTELTEEIVIIRTRLGTVVCRGYFAYGAAIAISADVASAVLLGVTSITQVPAYNGWKRAAEIGLKTTCG